MSKKIDYVNVFGDLRVFKGEVRIGTIMGSGNGKFRFFPKDGNPSGPPLELEALKKKIEKEYAK